MNVEYTIEPIDNTYAIAPMEIFDNTEKDFNYNDLSVWFALCSFAKWKMQGEKIIEMVNGSCCPTLQEIANRARCSVPTAKKGIRHLEKLGYVTMKERRGETGKRLSNEYVLKT